MTEQESLYSAILEEPADDLRRGVYADWLDENGQPERASLIRVMIAHPEWFGDKTWQDSIGGEYITYPADYRDALDWLKSDGAEKDSAPCRDGDWVWNREHDGVVYVYRRGFVDEVRLPLTAYLGGPCEWCQGSGEERVADAAGDMDDVPCRVCKGDRDYSTPGLAAALFAAHPIQVVRPTDVEPQLGDPSWWGPNNNLPYTWCSATDSDSTSNLPRAVFDRLEPHPHPVEGVTTKGGVVAWYPSEQAAWDYLSDALVAIGRERARVVATVAT